MALARRLAARPMVAVMALARHLVARQMALQHRAVARLDRAATLGQPLVVPPMVRLTALSSAMGLIRATAQVLEVALTLSPVPVRVIAVIQVTVLTLTKLIPIMEAALDWEA